MTDSEKLIKLKELLLNEDRDFAQNILEKLDSLEDTINTPEKLSQKVDGIIDRKTKRLYRRNSRKTWTNNN